MPAFVPAEAAAQAHDFMVLQVNDLIPGSSGGVREFNAQIGFSPESAQKMISMSHNDPKTILRASRRMKAWISTQGSSLKLRMEKSQAQPGVLGDPAAGRCTLTEAEGNAPSDRVAMKFRITAKR
jgi:hypothetical protein